MTREEVIIQLQILKNMLIRDEYIFKTSIMEECIDTVYELLTQPPTLAEFLGWEEGVWHDVSHIDWEYLHQFISIFKYVPSSHNKKIKIINGQLEFKSKNGSGHRDMDFVIDALREATKVEEPKYYAKIKGWELVTGGFRKFWHYDGNNKLCVSLMPSKNDKKATATKSEWAKLGINDSNADFEEVEE